VANTPQKNIPAGKKTLPKQSNLSKKKKESKDYTQWIPFTIIILTGLIYIRALSNGFVNLDDDIYIVKNPLLLDFSWAGIKSIFSSVHSSGNYHPFTILSNLFEFTLFKLNPLPYHLVNILLHLLNTWLVYKLSERLSGNKITALVVSILFAIHPMHVESVAWVSERKDVLYAFFYLSASLVYLRYMESGFRMKYYWIALLLFLASLLSKSAAVTLTMLLIATDLYKGRKMNARAFIEKIPFLLLSLFFGVIALLTQDVSGASNDLTESYSIFERGFLISYAVAFYIIKLIAPFNLSAMHYYPVMVNHTLPWFYYASLPFDILLIWLVFRKNSYRKEIVFGFFFFLISISVMLQIIPVGRAITAERYTYIPYIGLFYIAGQLITSIVSKKLKQRVIALLCVFIILFSYLAWARIGIWRDSITLMTDAVNKAPGHYYGYWMRGLARSYKGDGQGAMQDYNAAIRLNPGFADVYNERALLYYCTGNKRAALSDFNKAIFLNPGFAFAYSNRGKIYLSEADTSAALNDFNHAIRVKPDYIIAYKNRGLLKAYLRDLQGALKDINKALELSPNDAEAYFERGYVKALQKNHEEAIKDYDLSLKFEPDNGKVYGFRGNSRLALKDSSGALQDMRTALRLGTDPEAK
jgi:protein O-mannosyl-transferase